MSCTIAIKQKKSKPPTKTILRSSLNTFYKQHFIKILTNDEITDENVDSYKLNSSKLLYILAESSKSMEISYRNNVQLNFIKYVRQFVNQSFKKEVDLSKDKKQFNRELSKVKDDVVNNTLKSNEKFHKWIINCQTKILPQLPNITNISHYEYIKSHTKEYLKCMLYVNQILETNELKTFQPAMNRYQRYLFIGANYHELQFHDSWRYL